MGIFLSKAIKPIKNTGIEYRKDKLLEKIKPKVAPRHPNTYVPDLDQKSIDKIFNKSSSLVNNMNSLELKSSVIKEGILPEGTDYVKDSNRSYPQKFYSDSSLPEPRLEHGFIVPDVIPEGTLKIQFVIEILSKYQRKEHSVEELAREYNMPTETLRDIVEHFSLFEFQKQKEWLPPKYLSSDEVKLVESHKFYEDEPLGGFSKLTNKKIMNEENQNQLKEY